MPDDDEVLECSHQGEWAQWLAANHASSAGVWLRHARKGNPQPTVTYAEALEVALCFGWIDSRKKSAGELHFLQRWTPRSARSIWSKVNREAALRYIEQGRMQPAGLAEVERARRDGRWDAAYDSVRAASVPPDLQAALDASPAAAKFFATLSSQNRYAILFRVQTAKKPATRAARIQTFIQMLTRGETIHPQRSS
ncbi:YdeI/OmpD-associated family protein [Massilia solisilvae]|uniref:YdeI/OmpD-associated family protein n=1 Tax=Massilia solisilvae TaxID=1811225 RepID=A0ABT2BG26_9BURK|nr:YdeI/OmpD-associated family protein [Massilia solisilvae]MCS0607472.1 YdeI/OmpD-associated family protein [Massilia solisilvae]